MQSPRPQYKCVQAGGDPERQGTDTCELRRQLRQHLVRSWQPSGQSHWAALRKIPHTWGSGMEPSAKGPGQKRPTQVPGGGVEGAAAAAAASKLQARSSSGGQFGLIISLSAGFPSRREWGDQAGEQPATRWGVRASDGSLGW